jgi:PAS domain S-box-containing protein
MTGFTLKELQGKQLHYFIHHTHPDGRPYPLEECPIDQALPAHKQMQGEEVFVHRNGSFFPVTFTASPIIIDGKATGTVIEVRNTAEEKKREQALRESNERFQLINKATQDAIWDWDLQANTLLWNEALYSMFGYEAAACRPNH